MKEPGNLQGDFWNLATYKGIFGNLQGDFWGDCLKDVKHIELYNNTPDHPIQQGALISWEGASMRQKGT